MIVRSIYRSVLAAVAVVVFFALVGVGQASAAMPWWHLNTISSPASTVSEGSIFVEASDLGDAMVNSVEYPVTIVDTLPAGVTPTAVHPEGNSAILDPIGELVKLLTTCGIAGQTVTCTYGGFRGSHCSRMNTSFSRLL